MQNETGIAVKKKTNTFASRICTDFNLPKNKTRRLYLHKGDNYSWFGFWNCTQSSRKNITRISIAIYRGHGTIL